MISTQFWFLGYVLQFSNTLFNLLICLIFTTNIFTIFTKFICSFFCTNYPAPIHWVSLMTLSSTAFCPFNHSVSWRRKCQATPVFLTGKSQGLGSLVGYSSWGRNQLDMMKWLNTEHNHLVGRDLRSGQCW